MLGLYGQAEIGARADEVGKHANELNHLQEANGERLRISRSVRNALLDKDAAAIDRRATDIGRYDARFRADFEAYRLTIARDASAANIERLGGAGRPQQDEVVELARAGKPAEASARLPQIRAQADTIERVMNELVSSKQELMKQAQDEATATNARCRRLVTADLAVACALAVLLGVALTRAIVGPLWKTVEVLTHVAQGDLTQRADVRSRDEIGSLAASLNATVRGISIALAQDQVSWEAVGKQREQNADFAARSPPSAARRR